MKTLYSKLEFENAKPQDKLCCQCYNCNKKYFTTKKLISHELKYKRGRIKFCSPECNSNFQKRREKINCTNCNEIFYKKQSEIKKSKSGNHFCSKSCSTSYNNKHKTHGTRRSKLEIYLEEQLIKLYPKINFHFNRKDAINSELDIYIPSLKLAFELNGIFHYEPIFGSEKLKKIQNNDQRKFQACLENNIELVLVNSSQLKYFKHKNADKYLNIISEIIDRKY